MVWIEEFEVIWIELERRRVEEKILGALYVDFKLWLRSDVIGLCGEGNG